MTTLSQPTNFEYRSKEEINGWPLIHINIGTNPETGQPLVAKGIVAIGNIAFGIVSIGGATFDVFVRAPHTIDTCKNQEEVIQFPLGSKVPVDEVVENGHRHEHTVEVESP